MKDDEFSDLLNRAARNLPADVDALISGASVKGAASLRRRRIGTVFAGAGLAAALTAGVLVAPQLLGDPAPADVAQTDPGFAAGGPSAQAPAQPAVPDRPITVGARDIPAVVADALGGGGHLGSIVEDSAHHVLDKPKERLVHFRWKGTLTTVWIMPAQRQATCTDLAADNGDGSKMVTRKGEQPPTLPTREPNDCRIVDGLEVLVSPASDLPVKAHGATAWNHGYEIFVNSYNVEDGKNPDGSENVPPLMDQPAIDMDDLIALVTSEVWFN